jgi:hypothetical protein
MDSFILLNYGTYWKILAINFQFFSKSGKLSSLIKHKKSHLYVLKILMILLKKIKIKIAALKKI